MKSNNKEVVKAVSSAMAGGVVGAGTYSVIGGVGVAALGTAVGVGLVPFVALGAGLGAVIYGSVKVGKRLERKAFRN